MDWPSELAEALGPGRILGPLGAEVHRAEVSGSTIVVKSTGAARDEAAGLGRLAAAGARGGPRVPAVLYCGDGILALEWIASGPPAAGSEERLGRALAGLHSVTEQEWGGGSSWIGDCPVDPSPHAAAAGFYGFRLDELARRCGLEEPVGRIVERLPELIPPGPPSLLHGDLWWGNVLWPVAGDRPAVIDPSVHAGHPEEDLAMLALFGPVPRATMEAYQETRPLPAGWQQRVGLWQTYPLLVHTVLFGGAYRAQVIDRLRRYS